ncbi:MAG: class II aldolase/adducin family protein [Candidatus Eremiobacteraeota bacterium]|nr:class II aldolase/adducin family protein [Candidatus Eremiobacteraeota bacterium]
MSVSVADPVAVAVEPASELAPIRDRVSADEWRMRVDLAAAYRLVAHFGWDDLIFTHISARVPGPEHHFLINPYGMLFSEITASSLVKVDLNGHLVEPSAYYVNPAGFTIHSAVHAAREDAHCVMHLHTTAGVAVSAQQRGLLPLNQTAMLVINDLSYHEYEGVALNHDERPRLVADLGSTSVMLLRNHGTLAVGSTVASAFLSMYFLERACATQVATLAGNPDIHWPAAEVQALVAKQASYSRGSIDDLAWAPLIRLLDRNDPSYRD